MLDKHHAPDSRAAVVQVLVSVCCCSTRLVLRTAPQALCGCAVLPCWPGTAVCRSGHLHTCVAPCVTPLARMWSFDYSLVFSRPDYLLLDWLHLPGWQVSVCLLQNGVAGSISIGRALLIQC